MFKKAIAGLLIAILSLPTTTIFANNSYESRIDAIVSELSHNKLISLDEKIESIFQSEKEVSEDQFEVLFYLEIAIEKRLAELETELIKKLPPVSDTDKQLVEDEVMKIQNNVVSGLQGHLHNLIGEFDKLLHVQEKGNFKMTIDVDHEDIGKVSGGIDLIDYIATSNGFDSQLETDITAFLDVDSQGEYIDFDMSAFVDYITKDGNIYVLMQDLQISENDIPGMQDVVEMMQAIADENKYINIDGADPEEVLKFLENFHPDHILGEAKTFLEQPLFEAYTQVDDRYILVPTKYACDQGKQLQGVFDPFYSSDACSEGQYEDLVQDFLGDEFQLYMEIDRNTTLGFDAMEGDNRGEGNIVFNDSTILSSYLNISDKYNDIISFEFKRSSHCNLSIIGDDSFLLEWKADLGQKNTFKSATLDIFYDEYGTQFISNIDVKRGSILGETSIIQDGEEFFTLSTSGIYNSNYLDVKNTFSFAENPFESSYDIEYVDEEIEGAECYDNYYGDEKYICYVDKEPSEEKISGNLNIIIDTQSNKNNLDIELDVSLDKDKIIEIQLENTATRKFGDFEIETPTDTVPFEEIIEDVYKDIEVEEISTEDFE